jgi:starvation-inducible outer membrane lipoprotein
LCCFRLVPLFLYGYYRNFFDTDYKDMTMLKPLLIALSTAALLSGCASTPTAKAEKAQTEQVIAAAEKSGLVCTREKKLGSNKPIRTCRTKEQIALERETTRREMGQKEMRSSRSFY